MDLVVRSVRFVSSSDLLIFYPPPPKSLHEILTDFFLQIGIACSFLVKCKNSTCSRSFHTFCLDPPLQEIIGTWECSWCKSNAAPAVKVTEVLTSKKIQRLVGHRRILQEAEFQYQFLVKWQSLSHHHDCWVC